MASLSVDSLTQLLELLGQQGAPLTVVEAGFLSQFKPESFPLVVSALRAMFDQCYEQIAELQTVGESLVAYFLLSVVGAKAPNVRALLHQQLSRLETLLRDGAFQSEMVKLKTSSSKEAKEGEKKKALNAKDMQALDSIRAHTVQKAFIVRCLLDTIDKSATVASLLEDPAEKLEAEVAGWADEAHRLNPALEALKASAKAEPSIGGLAAVAIPAPAPISMAAPRVTDANPVLIAPRFVRPEPCGPPLTAADFRFAVFPSAAQQLVLDPAGHPAHWRLVSELLQTAAKEELPQPQQQKLASALTQGNGKKDATTDVAKLLSCVGLNAALFNAVVRHSPAVATTLLQKVPAEAPAVLAAMLDGLLEVDGGSAACTASSVVLAAGKKMTPAHVAKYAVVAVAGIRAADASQRAGLVKNFAVTLHQLTEKAPLAAPELSPALGLFAEHSSVADVQTLWGSQLR